MGFLANPGKITNSIAPQQGARRSWNRVDVLAITKRGTGQILDISDRGLSFGCLYPHAFPHEFQIDLLSSKGSHIKKVKVKKITESNTIVRRKKDAFEVIVGVEFTDLSPSQTEQLNNMFASDLI